MPKLRLEEASDFELRCLLKERGYPNLPITETTRNIIIKKLKSHLCNTNGQTCDVPKPKYSSIHQDGGENAKYNGNFSQKHSTARMDSSYVYSTKSPQNWRRKENKPVQVSPKVYAPPPILDSDSGEEPDYLPKKNKTNSRMYPQLNLEQDGINNSTSQGKRRHFGVVTRLLNLRDKTLFARQIQSNCSHSEVAVPHLPQSLPGSRNYAIHEPASKDSATLASHITHWVDHIYGFKQHLIPSILIALFTIFLLSLSLMYIIISPDISNLIQESSTHFVICNTLQDEPHIKKIYTSSVQIAEDSINAQNCIESSRLHAAIELSKVIIGTLQNREKLQNCNKDENSKITVTADEIAKMNADSATFDIREYISDVEYLIHNNPQWKVSIVRNMKDLSASDILETSGTGDYFILRSSNIPIMCNIYNKINRFFVIVGSGGILVVAGFLLYFAFRHLQSWRKDRLILIGHFQNKILEEMQRRANLATNETENDSVIIVDHLRDRIIPSEKRSALLGSWNKALRILEMNDNRIQFGVCIRNGQEYRTVQWVGNTLDREKPRYSKKWQSPAFDNVNKITNPPTSCLKIRHMFDASESNDPNLNQIINEAIMKKIDSSCKICDIQIDRQSCCVYVRCASEADAGVVHNEINGWWFDNRLISIKFLRLHRFLHRFPKSD